MFRYVYVLGPLLLLLGSPGLATAQHSDIEFFYDAGQIQLKAQGPGLFVYGHSFPTSGLFARFTSNPGFASEADAGLGVSPDDILGYNVLDNLFYWDGSAFVSPGASNIVIGNATAPDTTVNATSGVQPANVDGPAFANIIGAAGSAGDYHSHVDFTLSDGSPLGAYGLLLSLSSSADVADSQMFGILFNYGLPTDQYDAGVQAFNDVVLGVPEPTGVTLAAIGGALVALGTLRKRRSRG